MDEPLQEEQLVQNTENKHNQFLPFIFHKKLAIPIFVGLFFLVFGVGAFYVGKHSTNNKQGPYPSIIPTSVQMIFFPTNKPQLIPTSSPTLNIDQVCKKDSDCQIYGAGANCQNSENCPPNYYEGICISGKCVYSKGTFPTVISNNDYLNWLIKNTCFPGPEANNKQWEVFKALGDGTFIYRNSQTREMFRGTENNCE
ncbi:hypothetical protein A3H80_03080 [Candidatus Roizmanbacteria bacterium RIFCSPLOWO2_02_FULL_37_19]|uniref:Transmembrane protein n=1 Tax=Candidatus Roizmanbacteria bacterium RIFCSPHIGHO2_02_FULL_37_24 TaxID=1802037 RepID=A0A1F7GY60_9BACT|nr:MAG: hypothetical protein A3C24_02980 [Candidatus Roizmanbacteria bacterium RIFCSPHIGHO2_02_FULL_37_24]OGK32359.1 MAG: hypothetical protein A3E10_04210 [Candidatus Roizmanbacteria bacterium RIFCSPHIGHO2_12_FULL_37_23]OGK44693.1 MAG: hypothetical protein A2956_01010 [Candidatus Roizmanbacteria bacterium RIFCSPLOWO2_01_FULL_37_57]OGK53751.1 MAG: hypothetical protein A3H80_03080 [Candidatus Roizmanbacteria bacterium RIFCSPLOWO2_02_FULL_37_19]OGK61395.1 MAG: hypothetical protein A3G65_01615 [Can